MFLQPDTSERFVMPEGHWVWAMNVPSGAIGTQAPRHAHLVVLTPDALHYLGWPAADPKGWARLVDPLKGASQLDLVVPKGMRRIPYTSLRSVSYLAAKELLEIEVDPPQRSAFARAMVPDRPLQLFMPGTGMAEEIFRGLHQRIDPTLPVTTVPVRVDQIPVSPREMAMFLGMMFVGIVLFAASYSSPTDADPVGNLLWNLGAVPCRVLGVAVGAAGLGLGGWQVIRRPDKQVLQLAGATPRQYPRSRSPDVP